MDKGNLLILGTVFILALIIGILVLISPDPLDYTTNVTITVAEKYPLHTYDGMCGKYPCTKIENAKIVDTNGELWNFNDESAWARMKVNETYVMKVGTLPTDAGKVYSATKIE